MPLLLFKPRPRLYQAHYEGVLGTTLTLQVQAESPQKARAAEAAALDEIERLERIFSSFLPDSELSRWQAQGVAVLSPELHGLLREAEGWMAHTQGAFNPAAAAIQALYRQNPKPTEDEREALRRELKGPLWRLEGSRAHKLTALPLTFNALAKGHIVDAVAQAAQRAGGLAVLLDLGGEIRHLGAQSVRVLITNPFAQADNAPPLARLKILNQGVATSGISRRGHHLFDPRTAQPATQVTQATVVAPSAATADVLATAFCVLEPMLSLSLAEVLGVGCLLVEASGHTHTNLRFVQMAEEIREDWRTR